MEKNLFKALAAIAAVNVEGYTVDAHTLQPVTTGYAVAVAATQNSFGPEGLARVIDYVTTHDDATVFGGWYNSENGQYYYDATIIVTSYKEARRLAELNKQIAFFDLAQGEEIKL